uniref:CX domain-containing protein n=1 Tax=Caenorhabditis japonica TaxID=281687 RepID=A0A8R1HPL5_CAEJA
MKNTLIIFFLLILPMTFAMVVWPVLDRNTTRSTHVKPRNWSEKNLGQWCRNFTVNQHTQCPQASAFHQFDCCGPNETDCCFALQGWVIVILTVLGCCSTIIIVFFAFLKLNLICPIPYKSAAKLSTYAGIRQ